MNEEKKDKSKKVLFSGVLNKIKGIKHIEVLIAIIFIAIILLIYFSSGSSINKVAEEKNNEKFSSVMTYSKEMENKIENVLSKIKDAGEVSVMINCESGYELKIAYTTETIKKIENSIPVETTVKTPVMITENGKTSPVVLEYISPKIKNVIIVASGAENTNVKLELIRAVEILLNIPATAIQVFTGN